MTLRNVGVHNYENGYVKKARHFSIIPKEEYATIIYNRVNNFVVQNKRIMNPVDRWEKDCWFLTIDDPAGEMVACVRIRPPHIAYEYQGRQYSVWDKAWITDPTVSLFPIPEFDNANAYIWTTEWVAREVGTGNAIMDMYEDTHSILMFFQKHMPGLSYLGTEPDKYGFDGYKWVYEEDSPEVAMQIIRKYIESKNESKLSSASKVTA